IRIQRLRPWLERSHATQIREVLEYPFAIHRNRACSSIVHSCTRCYPVARRARSRTQAHMPIRPAWRCALLERGYLRICCSQGPATNFERQTSRPRASIPSSETEYRHLVSNVQRLTCPTHSPQFDAARELDTVVACRGLHPHPDVRIRPVEF